MFRAVCAFSLGALMGGVGGLLLVSSVYLLVKGRQRRETAYGVPDRWLSPSVPRVSPS
jgi:hypothetical protein